MEVIQRIESMVLRARELKAEGRRIGLVPTMGFLHEGHISLMRRLRGECDSLWVSIFVNPAQFGPAEDLDRYPRSLERDLELCREAGVDGVFHPAAEEVYPKDYRTWVEPPEQARRYCGRARPGHFRGVLSIVLRLCMWTSCDCAVFGRKDAQQLWLIRKMARDFSLPVEIVEAELVREADGLALSSRNSYLSPEERRAATVLHSALVRAAEELKRGRALQEVLTRAAEMIREQVLVELEYLHAVDWESLDSLGGYELDFQSGDLRRLPSAEYTGDPGSSFPADCLLMVAARLGGTRLIDNLRIE